MIASNRFTGLCYGYCNTVLICIYGKNLGDMQIINSKKFQTQAVFSTPDFMENDFVIPHNQMF